jgi:UDP-2,4-diacetamido-2,4,6-trideoxy-beta-L-altropyranose hydrolase
VASAGGSGITLLRQPWLGAAAWDYQVGEGAMLLAGPQYALLHPVYAATRPEALRRRGVTRPWRRVLVCLGGADDGSLSESVLERIVDLSPEATVCVIARAGNPPAKSLDATRAVVETRWNQSPEQMAAAMLWADFAVATPSTISLELSCLGVPSVLLSTAENQRRLAEYLSAEELAVVPGGIAQLGGSLRDASRHDWSRWSALCPGRGATLVADYMSEQMRGQM